MAKVVVVGKSGQLGRSLQAVSIYYPDLEFSFLGRDELDFSQLEKLQEKLAQYDFDVLINCSAYTAVDKAESEPDLANVINHQALKYLAEAAKQQDAKLIHISTDYVFSGKGHRPYREDDKTDPVNTYGFTKLKGEQVLLKKMPQNALIIRTSWVYSEYGNNFVKTMLKLGQERESLNVINDQVGTPTYAMDLAQLILSVVQSQQFNNHNQLSNIYHYSNEGVCSWYDFAKTIFELAHIDCKVNPIEAKDYPAPAKRPYYSLMNKAKIKQDIGVEIPYWKDSLHTCLNNLKL